MWVRRYQAGPTWSLFWSGSQEGPPSWRRQQKESPELHVYGPGVGVCPILENSTACQKSMPSLISFRGVGWLPCGWLVGVSGEFLSFG
jgi:hypothetical protein